MGVKTKELTLEHSHEERDLRDQICNPNGQDYQRLWGTDRKSIRGKKLLRMVERLRLVKSGELPEDETKRPGRGWAW